MKNKNSIVPDNYKEFLSLTLRTRNSKKPLRMLARNWKRRWHLLCLARQARKASMERPVAKPLSSNQNLRVFWKPVNPQDCVLNNLYRIIMMTILQERVTIHCNMIIWYTNLFLCLMPWGFPQQSQQWIKNGRNWKRFRRGTWRKSVTNLTWLLKPEKEEEKYTSLHWWTSVIWRMPSWRQSTKNTKVELCSEDTLWKMILDLMQFSLNKGHQHQKDSSKSHGYHIQTARVHRTRSWCSICLYPSKNGRCSKIFENSQIGMSWHLDSSTTTQVAWIMVQYGRPSRSSWAKSVRSSFGRTVMGKAIWENPIEVQLGEGFQLGMLIRTPWKRVVLICVCGWHKIGWKETKQWSDVANTQ